MTENTEKVPLPVSVVRSAPKTTPEKAAAALKIAEKLATAGLHFIRDAYNKYGQKLDTKTIISAAQKLKDNLVRPVSENKRQKFEEGIFNEIENNNKLSRLEKTACRLFFKYITKCSNPYNSLHLFSRLGADATIIRDFSDCLNDIFPMKGRDLGTFYECMGKAASKGDYRDVFVVWDELKKKSMFLENDVQSFGQLCRTCDSLRAVNEESSKKAEEIKYQTLFMLCKSSAAKGIACLDYMLNNYEPDSRQLPLFYAAMHTIVSNGEKIGKKEADSLFASLKKCSQSRDNDKDNLSRLNVLCQELAVRFPKREGQIEKIRQDGKRSNKEYNRSVNERLQINRLFDVDYLSR